MAVNRDKVDLWKADIAKSVDFYNYWFMTFAPKAYRDTRIATTEQVQQALEITENLTNVSPQTLQSHPSILSILRMTTCPLLARDRLIGLSQTPPNLVENNDVQFNDALVSSAIVWFENKKSSKKNQVRFTVGSSITQPRYEKEISLKILDKETKWTRFPIQSQRFKKNSLKLGDFFTIKRGIATGDNKFFIISHTQIEQLNLPMEYFRPILPSPRHLNKSEIYADQKGYPKIKQQLFVLDCKLPIETIKESYPNLYIYLKEGIKKGVTERYLCKSRKIWYAQESRKESMFYCTYIGRSDKKGKNPFRFILNHSKAIVSNSYLILYPKSNLQNQIDANPMLSYQIIKALNQITSRNMIDEGRVYGGGMYKLEPKELSKVLVNDLNNLLD